MSLVWKKISAFIERLENSRLSFWEGALLLYGIFFIRTFLENFANSGNFYHLSGVVDTFFHYPSGFLLVVLSSIAIICLLTKEEIGKISKVVVFCSSIIILPPILDLIFHGGHQIPYIFLSGTLLELSRSFVSFFGGGAITPGIKTEVFLALLGIGIYIFYKRESIGRAVAGAFLLYAIIFVFLASPALIFSAYNFFSGAYPASSSANIGDFYFHKELASSLTGGKTFIIENGSFYPALTGRMENQYAITLSIIFMILDGLLLGLCLFLYSEKKFWTAIKNFRFLRVGHYFLLTAFGVYLGLGISGRLPFGSLYDFLGIFAVFGAVLSAWLFAVWENDEVDIAIDRISNSNRPLPQGHFSLREWGILKYLFLLGAVSFGFLSGLYVLIFILLFIFSYHLYSVPPTRFKRLAGISSLFIGINAVLAVWIGFFATASTENLNALPARFVWGIFAIFFLAENVKNIKDIEGDRQNDIKTLPVILGEKKGKLIVGLSLFIATLIMPAVFDLKIYAYAISAFFGIILFLLVNKKIFSEKNIFLTYFLYALVIFILINT